MGPTRCQSSKTTTYKLPKPEHECFSQTERSHLLHGAVVIELPVEVEVRDADTAGVCARQHDCAAIHGLQEGNLSYRHLKGLSRPHA